MHLPFEFTEPSASYNDDRRFQEVDQIKQHMPSVLGVNSLTNDSEVEVGSLEDRCHLLDK